MTLQELISELILLQKEIPENTRVYISLDPEQVSPLESTFYCKKIDEDCRLSNCENQKETIVVLSPVWYRFSL